MRVNIVVTYNIWNLYACLKTFFFFWLIIPYAPKSRNFYKFYICKCVSNVANNETHFATGKLFVSTDSFLFRLLHCFQRSELEMRANAPCSRKAHRCACASSPRGITKTIRGRGWGFPRDCVTSRVRHVTYIQTPVVSVTSAAPFRTG